MLNSVKNAINKYNMLQNVGTVTVALSGGADSVSLLHALLRIKDEYGIMVEAAHLNHGIRGEEADRDEQFVREFCEKLGVKLFCERVNVPEIAKQTGQSLELAARQVRYDFLFRVAKDIVATAHTASDNIETVLFNMSRGTGLDGMCGIPPKRENVIRPLILVTREDVEAYCEQNSLKFCTDSTNLQDEYARNRIRHNVVPQLKEINSGAVGNVQRMCANLSDDAEFLEKTAKEEYNKLYNGSGLEIGGLKELHPSIKTRCISMLAFEQTGCCLEYTHISAVEKMLDDGGLRTSIKCDFEATSRKGLLRFEKKAQAVNTQSVVSKFPFSCEGYLLEKITAKEFEEKARINSLLLKSAIDCDKICGKLIFRTRLSGDSVKLKGRKVTKTLKKLFNESDLSASLRETIKVLSDDTGVLWVEGFGADEKVSVDENTKSVIMIEKCQNNDI